MAHEIAAAMQAAEAEGQASPAGDRARTLIMELWERRAIWPNGWPPRRAAQRLQALDPSHRPPTPVADDGTPWTAHVAELQRIAVDELRVFVGVGLLQDGTDSEREALEGAVGDDDDMWTLRGLVSLHDAALAWVGGKGAATPDELAALARGELEAIEARRRELVEAFLADVAQAADAE